MAIEFRCWQCGRLLRVGEEAAGRQAQCPECGATTTVPAPAAPFVSPPRAESAEPFGGVNPYQSPQQFGPPPPGAAMAAQVPNYLVQAVLCTIFSVLSMMLCICGVLGLPFGIVAIVFASQVNTKLGVGDYQGALAASKSARTWCWVSFLINLVMIVVGVVLVIVYVVMMVAAQR